MNLGAGGARQARYLSCLAKKGNPKKATRDTRPPPAATGSLCFSKAAAAAELASLKQSSPTTPRLPAMLGAPHGSPSVVAQTPLDDDSLFFIGLQAALVLVCRLGCEAMPERFAGQMVFVARMK